MLDNEIDALAGATNTGDNRSVASFLDVYLSPLAKHLTQSDVTDIYINQPGQVWVERLGGSIERQIVDEMSEDLLWSLARQVANVSHQAINRNEPLLAARLPDGSRIQIVAPPATRGPMAIAIRRHVAADMDLSDYVSSGAFDTTVKGNVTNSAIEKLRQLYCEQNWGEFLRLAVHARLTILISGGTSSGKTTFLNALLKEVPEQERLILIEDTPELELKQDNSVGLVAVRGQLGEAMVSAEDLLIASLRMRPDRIILGELRGKEALTFIRAINTGHPGSMTTIHANSADQAVEQLALLVGQESAMARADIISYINTTVDVFVQLANDSGKRYISSINWSGQA